MNDFDEAWRLTASHEGGWSDKGSDKGHFNKQGHKVGTTYGITPKFLYDYVEGWQKVITKQDMQNLSEEDCKEIFKDTCWAWIDGQSIVYQDIASLLFDWCVRANMDVMQKVPTLFGLKAYGGCHFKFFAPIEKRNSDGHILYDENEEPILWSNIGTRKTTDKDAKDKVWFFGKGLINQINGHPNPKKLFQSLFSKATAWYQSRNTMSRLNLYEWGDCRTKYDVPKFPKRKIKGNLDAGRKILFFTQKGCAPCVQKKPFVQALATKYNAVFEEVDVRSDSGKILMTQYRIAMTPEVVLIYQDKYKSFGAADLPDKLETTLQSLTGETVSKDDNSMSWFLMIGLGILVFK